MRRAAGISYNSPLVNLIPVQDMRCDYLARKVWCIKVATEICLVKRNILLLTAVK